MAPFLSRKKLITRNLVNKSLLVVLSGYHFQAMIMNTNETFIPHYNKVNPFVIIKGGAVGFIELDEMVFDAKENKSIRTPDKDG